MNKLDYLAQKEEELRKQLESLVGAIIFTGQEKPETGKHVLEDQLKKFVTAELLRGRLPYAILAPHPPLLLCKIGNWE